MGIFYVDLQWYTVVVELQAEEYKGLRLWASGLYWGVRFGEGGSVARFSHSSRVQSALEGTPQGHM